MKYSFWEVDNKSIELHFLLIRLKKDIFSVRFYELINENE